MTTKFGSNAYVTDEVRMGAEERTERTLNGTLPVNVPPLKLGTINNISKARIRRDLAEFTAGNVGELNHWLHQVADGRPPQYENDALTGLPKLVDAGSKPNPALAIQLFLAVAEFTMPKLKAVAVEISDPNGAPLKRYTMAELEAAVVAEQ